MTSGPRPPALRTTGGTTACGPPPQIRFADFGTTRRYTNADPRDGYRLVSASGLGLACYGTIALWGSYRMSRRPWTSLGAYPWQAALPVGGGLALTLLEMAAPFVTDGIGPALRLVALGAIVVLLLSLVLVPLLRRRQADDDNVTLRPCPPLKKMLFPGRHGHRSASARTTGRTLPTTPTTGASPWSWSARTTVEPCSS